MILILPPVDLSHTYASTDDHIVIVHEDDPAWSCVDDGNRICGPGNPQGAPAGQYDEGGVLTIPWDQLPQSRCFTVDLAPMACPDPSDDE